VHACKNRWGGRQSKDENKRLKERRMKNRQAYSQINKPGVENSNDRTAAENEMISPA